MSNTLSLASRLRSLDDAELTKVIAARGISATGIKDFFDLAEAFLDRASIQQMLTRLDRSTLAVLAAIAQLEHETPGDAAKAPTVADVAAKLSAISGEPPLPDDVANRAASAAALLLLEHDGDRFSAYDSVRLQLRSWPAFGLPGLEQLAAASPPAALEPVPDVDHRFIDRLGAERAFAATTEITQLLVDIEREPARELAKGGVALPDTKRLAHAMSVELDNVPTLIAVAERASLLAREHGSWMITDQGGSWLLTSSADRWAALVAAWFEELPGDIRTLLGERTHALWGQGLRGYIDWLYPAGGEWMDDRITVYTRDAELLGVTANQAPTGPGALLLAEGVESARDAIVALLPAEVEQVYLQHDLSVVAPGPLTPRVDARLRSMADVESRALAATYRVSTSSVNRAMAAGDTAASILEFLGGVSLTGIPQPLQYLVADAANRYGSVRVGSLSDSVNESYVSSADPQVLGTIMVDQNLSTLGFQRFGDGRLVSRFPADLVFWSLSDARYPVAAEDDSGAIIELRRRRTARALAASGIDPVAALVERLRLGGEPDAAEDGQAWLQRQLDTAIKARAALTVSVTMPNGSVVDYQLEPTSVAGGRLRGRDRRSAIERTLPLSSIASVGPAE